MATKQTPGQKNQARARAQSTNARKTFAPLTLRITIEGFTTEGGKYIPVEPVTFACAAEHFTTAWLEQKYDEMAKDLGVSRA
ncbi:hypothetical protein [Pseudoclavibacter sp. RFBB5]|uniref:hypothetical protein n=1 Tax=Pseudoclavibacter sp. RFBB5 TaxID=2080574 RepID=UPI000CE83F1C|nr:hypothetical protein [Pseudoclavibacter sp. RFBB5]PPG29638.1 hypothetical protein C5B97_11745 [Pseudoclavibacter sp. RFBB5]